MAAGSLAWLIGGRPLVDRLLEMGDEKLMVRA
jgi:hypothetical protein